MNTTKSELKKSFEIGFVCIFTYLASYYIRNILNVLTPSMLSEKVYTKEILALFSSTYMIVYAAGQLVNGVIGDYIKPKYMVSLGITVTGLGLLIFSFVTNSLLGIISFGIIGFGLSMLRGPLMKVITENMVSGHARVCCVFFNFAGFAGPLLAGLAAIVMNWHSVFVFSAILAFLMAIFAFFILTFFEKKGLIQQIRREKKGKGKLDILSLFKLPNFIPYMIIGMIVEIFTASMNFWMPTFFNEHLSIPENTSNMLFSAVALIRSFCPFVGLFVFKLLKERDMLMARLAFSASAALFLVICFIKTAWLVVPLFTLALICSSLGSCTLWSIYIPSLGKSGKVSSANGVLDCSGYVVASIVNVLLVPIMNTFGWSGVILSWGIIMSIGALVTLLGKNNINN